MTPTFAFAKDGAPAEAVDGVGMILGEGIEQAESWLTSMESALKKLQ